MSSGDDLGVDAGRGGVGVGDAQAKVSGALGDVDDLGVGVEVADGGGSGGPVRAVRADFVAGGHRCRDVFGGDVDRGAAPVEYDAIGVEIEQCRQEVLVEVLVIEEDLVCGEGAAGQDGCEQRAIETS